MPAVFVAVGGGARPRQFGQPFSVGSVTPVYSAAFSPDGETLAIGEAATDHLRTSF